jgi:hypothetical protein
MLCRGWYYAFGDERSQCVELGQGTLVREPSDVATVGQSKVDRGSAYERYVREALEVCPSMMSMVLLDDTSIRYTPHGLLHLHHAANHVYVVLIEHTIPIRHYAVNPTVTPNLSPAGRSCFTCLKRLPSSSH